ncbi:MAG TPA: hypothetical protein VFS97_09680 [Nitrososphaeraceae archaeon]|nr:hypothetical protein [Nitrososphaeraceae archaeon]
MSRGNDLSDIIHLRKFIKTIEDMIFITRRFQRYGKGRNEGRVAS